METSKWLISVFGVLLVTLIFYTGAEYNRMGNIENHMNNVDRTLDKLTELETLKSQVEYDHSEIDRLRAHLEKIGKIVE